MQPFSILLLTTLLTSISTYALALPSLISNLTPRQTAPTIPTITCATGLNEVNNTHSPASINNTLNAALQNYNINPNPIKRARAATPITTPTYWTTSVQGNESYSFTWWAAGCQVAVLLYSPLRNGTDPPKAGGNVVIYYVDSPSLPVPGAPLMDVVFCGVATNSDSSNPLSVEGTFHQCNPIDAPSITG
ncbi:hypothetical protein MMC12_001048 [Toensbergia leucococca]|nr:hypothetical protein [Toensbergia leucococca]